MTQETETRDTLVTWLEAVLRETGWSQTKLASVAGLDQSTINRFLSDEDRAGGMRASTIAKIVRASGIAPPAGLGAPVKGFGESEVVPFSGPHDRAITPDHSIWIVNTRSLAAAGFHEGDSFLLDMAAEPMEGEFVLANVYALDGLSAVTVLRLYQPPFLLNPAVGFASKPEYVDNVRVKIMGVIIERWRKLR